VSIGDAGLSARAAQVLYAYARAVDEGDIEALRGLAWPDVSLTRSDGTTHGIGAFLDLYRAFAASPVLSSKHAITNVQAFPDPDGTVRARAYFQAAMFDPGEQTRLIIGQYSDSMREVDGELRFTHKRIAVERVVTVASGTAEYTGVTPLTAGQAAG
jgi:3-phenylpropionate/cinnamic acid dioxygenase small subunit